MAELLTVQVGKFYKIPIPSSWIDLSCWQVVDRLRRTHDALLVALEISYSYPHRQTRVNPPVGYCFGAKDSLIVVARKRPNLVTG